MPPMLIPMRALHTVLASPGEKPESERKACACRPNPDAAKGPKKLEQKMSQKPLVASASGAV